MRFRSNSSAVVVLCILVLNALWDGDIFWVEAFLNSGTARHAMPNNLMPFHSTILKLRKDWFVPDSDEDEDDDDDDRLVTREMLLRDLLQDPKVKRKRKNGKEGYKPLDNRDHLPFSVRKITPDPYTHEEIKKAKQNLKSSEKRKRKRTDLDHHLTPIPKRSNSISNRQKKNNKATTASRLIQSNQKDGKDTSTVLGEFQLDKSTTSGDVIVVGDREYQVQTARCQYKYAGGQRFVMVRKILEVKEITRVYKEEALMRQYQSSPSRPLPEEPLDLE